MPAVVFFCQLHQPIRLRRYSVFDQTPRYFDDSFNQQVLQKVTKKCYRPALTKVLELVKQHHGRFRISFSITGALLEQLEQWQPEILELLSELGRCDGVEFLNETYYHSLAFQYSLDEFAFQIEKHADAIEKLTGKRPTAFRNTELIYNDALAQYLAEHGQYKAVLAEGVDRVLQGQTANEPYLPATGDGPTVLLRNYRLSDDIAFRFSDHDWKGWPLTGQSFAAAVTQAGERGRLCNICLDFESFGEHQWAETGIFMFLESLPQAILDASTENKFLTVSEAAEMYKPSARFHCPVTTSWADTERDMTAWAGNAMQNDALQRLYTLEHPILHSGDDSLIEAWRRLTISDHFYYMCTKYHSDMAVHNYFNHYESPYDSYINFMNVLDHVRQRALAGV